MLTSLSLRNFKCFESVDMPLGRITVLIGPNGSGKSSVLHALSLLRQSLGQNQLQFSGSMVDVSSFEDAVYSRDTSRSISIGYNSHHSNVDAGISYEYSVTSDNSLRYIGYRWNTKGDKREISWRGTNRTSTIRLKNIEFMADVVGLIGRHIKVNRTLHEAFDDKQRFDVQEIIQLPENDMKSWIYTPVPRGFTRGKYVMAQDEVGELLGDWDLSISASNLASSIAYNDRLESKISNWIKGVTGVSISARSFPGQRVLVRSEGNAAGGSVPIVNEGFGSGGLTFMFFQLARTAKGGLDMIEEPELHLHPYAIARLADLLTDEAVKSEKQLLLTTHSEHLLLGLLNNVAEGKLSHTDLVVLSTSLTEAGAKVERVNINEEGLAEGGLPGFFDATIEAQRRHLDALMNRG